MEEIGFDEVLKSLKIIKGICEKQEDCGKCPFYERIGCFCNITETDPSDWDINENKDIKYFN